MTFIEDIKEEVGRNSKAPFVRNFRDNYEGGELPIYALVEVFSFGTLSKFYKNMKNVDKKVVAKSFGIGYTYLESWLESISYVRNICAHYGVLPHLSVSSCLWISQFRLKQPLTAPSIHCSLYHF